LEKRLKRGSEGPVKGTLAERGSIGLLKKKTYERRIKSAGKSYFSKGNIATPANFQLLSVHENGGTPTGNFAELLKKKGGKTGISKL